MMNDMFVIPNLYHSGATGDGYVLLNKGTTNLLGIVAENKVNSGVAANDTRWLQFFDGYVQPTVGTVPLLSIKCTQGSQVSFGGKEIHVLPTFTGLMIASSTTGNTYTAGGASDFFLSVFWID